MGFRGNNAMNQFEFAQEAFCIRENFKFLAVGALKYSKQVEILVFLPGEILHDGRFFRVKPESDPSSLGRDDIRPYERLAQHASINSADSHAGRILQSHSRDKHVIDDIIAILECRWKYEVVFQ